MSFFRPIPPEPVAKKLAAIRNCEYPQMTERLLKTPRIAELLWFLQSQKNLKQFALDFLKEFPENIGTKDLYLAIAEKRQKLSFDECRMIYRQTSEQMCHEDGWILRHYKFAKELDSEATKCAERLLSDWNVDFFKKACTQAAEKELPQQLTELCIAMERDLSGHCWYFKDLIPTLFAAMDRHAERMRKTIAMTEVAIKIFDALEFAMFSRKGWVSIQGDSRFGKSEAVKAWAAMYPGKARLVTVPCSNSHADLLRAVGAALGFQFDPRATSRDMKPLIEAVLKQSRFLIILDEAHFLIPVSFSRNSSPQRLNWVRQEMIDARLPVAVVSTPQSYSLAVKKYVQQTGYTMEQFMGRSLQTLILPAELDQEDLLKVAKIHFPEFEEDYLLLVVAKAMQSENYLQAVEAIALRARYIAQRDGHPSITFEDLQLAISAVMPGSAPLAPINATPAPVPHRTMKPEITTPERSMQPLVTVQN